MDALCFLMCSTYTTRQLVPAASVELPTGPVPEGVAFTSDGNYVVVQSHASKEMWLYAVESERLRDTGERVKTPGFPSSLRSAPYKKTTSG